MRRESSSIPVASIDPSNDEWLRESGDERPIDAVEVNQRLRALCELARDAYDWQTHEQAAQTALAFLQRLLSAERCIIAVQAPDGGLRCVYASGIDAGSDPTAWPVSQSLLLRIREKHLAVLSTDAREDHSLKRFTSVDKRGIRSLLCVPLGTRQAARGLVYLDNRVKAGAFTRKDLHFVTAVCRLLDATIAALDRRQELEAKARRDQERIVVLQSELYARHRIVGQSAALLRAYSTLKRIASGTDVPILLTGESGTGKELFARAAHWSSNRRAAPFVAVSLAAATETLVGSELFGHERGAFSGASQRRKGLLERANGGTLFLDEIADIPASMQVRLLRVLQEKEFTRLGGDEPIRSDFRMVSATSRDLERLVESGQFRDDLYARVAGVTIGLPPLRERPDDIPALVDHFLEQANIRVRFSSSAMEFLQRQAWPRNIRQLQCWVQSVAALSEQAGPIELEDVQAFFALAFTTHDRASDDALRPVAEVLAATEKRLMERALLACSGNASEAARRLGIGKSTFSEKRQKYGI